MSNGNNPFESSIPWDPNQNINDTRDEDVDGSGDSGDLIPTSLHGTIPSDTRNKALERAGKDGDVISITSNSETPPPFSQGRKRSEGRRSSFVATESKWKITAKAKNVMKNVEEGEGSYNPNPELAENPVILALGTAPIEQESSISSGISSAKKRSSFVAAESKWKMTKSNLGGATPMETNTPPPTQIQSKTTGIVPIETTLSPPQTQQSNLKKSSSGDAMKHIVRTASFSPDSNAPPPLIQDSTPPLDQYSPAEFKLGLGGQLEGKDRSISHGTSLSQAQLNGAKEIGEPLAKKLLRTKYAALGVVINCIFLWWMSQMLNGVQLPISSDTITNIGAVVLELIVLLSNIITLQGMNDAIATLFGYWASEEGGYSMAASGFCRTSAVEKYTFVNRLSHNSTCKKFLTYLSFAFIFMELIKLLTPLPATALQSSEVLSSTGSVSCVLYNQNYSQIDRGAPSFEVEMGLAELVFGTSLGSVRSEFSLPYTTMMVGPQLLGAVQSNQWLVGTGLTANILTNCSCTLPSQLASYMSGVSTTEVSALYTKLNEAPANQLGTVFETTYDASTESIGIYNVFTGTQFCGGKNVSIWPICYTKVWDHAYANLATQYQTDGTPASICQVAVETYDNFTQSANMTWLYNGFLKMAPNLDLVLLPPHVPGLINPILYWTTRDLIGFDSAILEPGWETTILMLLRGAIQRTYNTQGDTCTVELYETAVSIIYLGAYGYYIACTILIIQLIFGFLSLMLFLPIFLVQHPFNPSIRAMNDGPYFGSLLIQSGLQAGLPILSSAETYTIWQALDRKVRIGESVLTVDEDLGRIVMEVPKMVRTFIPGRKYN